MKKATAQTTSQQPIVKIYPMALALFCMSVSSVAFAQLITIEDPANSSQKTQNSNSGAQNQDLIEEEALDQELSNNQQMPQVQGQPVQISSQALRSQPVAVSPGMAPQVATPVAQGYRLQSAPATYSDPNMGMAVSGASTGVGGNNPGNANTGGVQVQNVHVTATQDQVSENSSDLLKRARLLKEEETNREALDKIEENRFESEAVRRERVKGIFKDQALDNSADMGLDSVPQNMIAAAPLTEQPVVVPMTVAQEPLIQPTLQTSSSLPAAREIGIFKVVPMAGYRWFENDNAEYEAQNMGFGGVGLEGTLTKNLSIEGSFLYGRDEFNYLGAYGYNNTGYAATGYYNNGYYNNGYNSYNVNPLLAPRSRDSFEVNGALKLGASMGSVRPYVLGGIGGMMQKYNIDDSYTTEYLNQIGLSRSTTNVVGNFGAGMDFGSAQSSLLVGARFDYQSFFAGEYTEMQRIFGDISNRYRVIGSVQMVF